MSLPGLKALDEGLVETVIPEKTLNALATRIMCKHMSKGFPSKQDKTTAWRKTRQSIARATEPIPLIYSTHLHTHTHLSDSSSLLTLALITACID